MELEDLRQLHLVGNAVTDLTTAASKLPTNPEIERVHTKLANLCHEVAEAMVATQRRSVTCSVADEDVLARAALAGVVASTGNDPYSGRS